MAILLSISSLRLFQLLVIASFPCTVSAWITTANFRPSLTNRASLSSVLPLQDSEDGKGGGEQPASSSSGSEEKQRMAMVRSLQDQFYNNNNFTHAAMDQASGSIKDLNLWRAPWTELPGRSNMLNVHDPIYTNMFESILHQEKPWYIGHLYLPEGSQNLKSQDKAHTLKSWEVEKEDDEKTYPRSAVIGTLLKIADYRRMEDGRLLLLVEGLERFVVTHVKQELPYSIADVQLLPDTEEVDPDLWVEHSSEGEIREARSMALAESFQRYHPYEYDENFELPVPNKPDLCVQDIHGSMLQLVLPYVPLSKTADLIKLKEKPLELQGENSSSSQHQPGASGVVSELDDDLISQYEDSNTVEDEEPCLEQQLLEAHVLTDYQHPDAKVMQMTSAELEYKLWLAINDFLKKTKTPVSPVLLGLLPEGVDWPSNFYLRKIANDIAKKTDLKHNYVQVSMELPSHRRLRRLSFSATKILEGKPGMESLRQQLLETASTKARLALILDKLESYDTTLWGEFE